MKTKLLSFNFSFFLFFIGESRTPGFLPATQTNIRLYYTQVAKQIKHLRGKDATQMKQKKKKQMNHSCQSNAKHRNLLWKSASLTGSHSNAQGVLSNAFFLWRLSEHHYSLCGPLSASHNALWTAYHMVARRSKTLFMALRLWRAMVCVNCPGDSLLN